MAGDVEEQARVIERDILSLSQEEWLRENHLTVLDILTNRFRISMWPQVQFLFSEWNKHIGFRHFHP